MGFRRGILSAGVSLSVAAGCVASALRAAEPDLPAVLARAGAYVADFEQRLTGIVAEERYVQHVEAASAPVFVRRGDEPPSTRRELVSDLLLVKPIGANVYVQYRDVYTVDGAPVRERTDRLSRLFLEPSASWIAQVRRIVDESARYNIGRVARNINVPLLPIAALDPKNQPRFRFSRAKDDGRRSRSGAPRDLPDSTVFAVSTDVWIVRYDETQEGTLVRDSRHKDVPLHGRVWIEPDSGRVVMSEATAEGDKIQATIDVSYQSAPLLGLLVPVEMRERYLDRRDHTRIDGIATYSNFRQFQVRIDERFGPIK
jgi:hypothetical protein